MLLLLTASSLSTLAQRRGESPFPNVEREGDSGQRRGTRGNRGQHGSGPGCPPRGRIQKRTYLFKETDKKNKETSKKMEYDIFVPSKLEGVDKSPLVIGLHGLGVPPAAFLNCLTVDAEAGGYIVAAPMGYNETGYYGAGQQPPQDNPPNISTLSERDVMNVLELMRAEFKIDDRRIYIVGQSMGGAGALYLGTKYHDIWAAVGASAPAITRQHDPSELEPAAKVPMIIIHGTEDQTIPIERVLPWVAKMKALNMTYEYDEIPGAGHPDTIQRGVGYVFAFFNKHIKQGASDTVR
jgi:predicted peptidase